MPMKLVLSILLLFSSFLAKADEGMWLVHLLNQKNMQKMQAMGCKLTYQQIYSDSLPSIKDAIVAIDNGACTGSIISKDGLLLTNYHCALEDLQKLSSIENNYFRDGFKAGEEIHIPGKSVSFLNKVIDVSGEISSLLVSKSIRMAKNTIISKYSKLSESDLQIKYMNTEDKYYLFFYTTYTDIRLVALPPSFIANFGGDRDNFSWPQHKCDFALYRVYADSLSKPASFSKTNIPIKARYVIPIAKESPKEGDFTLTIGFPFKTDRYISSFELRNRFNENEQILSTKKIKIDILKKASSLSEKLRIKYKSELFDYSNQYKLLLGENTFISKYKLIQKKERGEEGFSCLKAIKCNCDSIAKYKQQLLLSKECFPLGCELFTFAFSLSSLEKHIKDSSYMKRYCNRYIYFHEKIVISLDKKICTSLLNKYFQSTSCDYAPVYLMELYNRYDGDIDRIVAYIYSKTCVLDKDIFLSILKKQKRVKILKDPLYLFARSVFEMNSKIKHSLSKYKKELRALNKQYLSELINRYEDYSFYPDANSSMRFSFGQMESFSPRDGILYKSYTRFSGLIEKCSRNVKEYKIPEKIINKLLACSESENSSLADMKIAFITNNDITSGSSGSPVLNARGELLGIAYDASWQSLSVKYYFHTTYNRTVCLDYKYVNSFMITYCL
jgi:hypothetical protein